MPIPSFFELSQVVALGAALGFFGGLFGIGGGIVAIPLLVLGFHMEQPLAQGTALVLMVPNLLVGYWRYTRRHPVGWLALLSIGLSATLSTWVVAHFAVRLDSQLLRQLFSGFLVLQAARLLWPRQGRAEQAASPIRLRALPWVGLAGGGSMGLFGIGGGVVATSLLSGWLGQRQTVAQSLSLALVAPSSVVALATYAQAQRVDWGLGVPMAVGGLLTVSAGVALAHRLPERRLRAAFAWILVFAAAWLALGSQLR